MCPKRPYKKGDRRKNAALMAIIVPAAIVAFVVVSPFLLYDCLKDTKSSRSKREKERDDRGRFPPRLLERPHALSFVDDESTVERPPSTGPDLKATLLTLPVEIRLLIFEHLIQPESDIHINYTRGRIRSYRCTCRLKGYEVSDYELCRCRYQASRWPNQTRNLTPYLRTCRAIYCETINLLYSQPHFVFSDYTSFIAFSSALVSSHFHVIRSLTFIGRPFITTGCNQSGLFASPVDYPHNQRYLADYHALHDPYFSMRGAVLPVLPPHVPNKPLDKEVCRARDPWGVMCGIIRLMEGVREVRLRIYSYEGDYVNGPLDRPWCVWGFMMMRTEVERVVEMLHPRLLEGEGWRKGVDVLVDGEGKRCVGSIVLKR